MHIYANALSGHSGGQLAPLYHLFGAEPLILEESLDTLREAALQAGYSERERFTLEPGFDWNRLFESGQTMSLFADKRLIELRMPSGKPGDQGAKTLIELAENPSSDLLLIVISGAIEKRAQNSKWFKALEAAGCSVECPLVYADKLPNWIEQRMRSRKLRFEPEVVDQLVQYVEGNLLAAAQEIDLLALLYGNQMISLQDLQTAIADHARFNVFALTDACLAGSSQRVLRILMGLKREHFEPTIILWALTRESRTLYHLSSAEANGQRAQNLFKRFGIWSNRSPLVNSALRRIPQHGWQQILRRLARADLMLKGRSEMVRRDIWEELEQISLLISGLRIC